MKLLVAILIALAAIIILIPLLNWAAGMLLLILRLLLGLAILIFVAGIVIRLIGGATRH